MEIRDFLKNNVLISDGAMGTYYAQLTGENVSFVEEANLKEAAIIEKIHNLYIKAGARLIRTNTFSLNRFTMEKSRKEIKLILKKGYQIAINAAHQEDVFVAADIGPVPEQDKNNNRIKGEAILNEYKFLIDSFIESGAEIFLFETFSSVKYLDEITEYIKTKNKNGFIIMQFALTLDGFTRKGYSINKILSNINNIKNIDVVGFNCGVGPAHLYNFLKKIEIKKTDIYSALPNAGYPEIINERTVYSQNPDYFAELMNDIKNLGVKIIGGCCGTTPQHIQKVREKIKEKANFKNYIYIPEIKPQRPTEIKKSKFQEKLEAGNFVIAVELDPPFSPDINNFLFQAQKLANKNYLDLITIPDSPLGRVRLDPVIISSKIFRESGVETMPHLTCRDNNMIALKAKIMSAHTEGLRNILLVTGDPVPGSRENEIKNVFALNSYGLIKLVDEMNRDILPESPFFIGAALNLNAENRKAEIKRMYKKIESGAKFFLTQPVFSKEVASFLKKFKKKHDIKILAGIMPPVSYKNARFLSNEIPGIKIPDHYINLFQEKMPPEEAQQVGIEIALDVCRQLKSSVDGFYFIPPFNRVDMINEIIEKL